MGQKNKLGSIKWFFGLCAHISAGSISEFLPYWIKVNKTTQELVCLFVEIQQTG